MKVSILSLICGALLVFGVGPADAADYTAEKPLRLSMTSVFMDNHPAIANGLLPWAKQIQERTGGRVVVEFYNPNTICSEGDIYEAIKTGIVSMGSQNITRNRGKFPLTSVMDQPFLYSSAESGSISNWRLFQKFPELQREFAETHVITFWSSAVDQIHSVRKPLNTLEELKGTQIGAFSGSYVDLTTALGASPVQLSPSDLYLALQRSQVDGVICPFAYMRSTKVYEAAKNSYVANLKTSGFYLTMNKDIWASLPQDIQQIFTELGGEVLAQQLGKVTDKGVLDDLKFMMEQGQVVTTLPQEERARWMAKGSSMTDKWIKECSDKGLTLMPTLLETARTWDAELFPHAEFRYQ